MVYFLGSSCELDPQEAYGQESRPLHTCPVNVFSVFSVNWCAIRRLSDLQSAKVPKWIHVHWRMAWSLSTWTRLAGSLILHLMGKVAQIATCFNSGVDMLCDTLRMRKMYEHGLYLIYIYIYNSDAFPEAWIPLLHFHEV